MLKTKKIILIIASVSIGICFLALINGNAETTEIAISKMNILDNKTDLPTNAISAEVQLATNQPLSTGAIALTVALSNHSEKKIAFQADAFLDAMRISLQHKKDPSLSAPANVRFLINAPVLPPRPYAISNWQLLTTSSGKTTTKELPAAILQNNDPKSLRKEILELPASSTMVLTITISSLDRKDPSSQTPKAEKVSILEGEYTLDLSLLLVLPKTETEKGGTLQLGLGTPLPLIVSKTEETPK